MSKTKRLVIANWKGYIEDADTAKTFVRGLRRRGALYSGVEVRIAPPSTLIPVLATALKGSKIGLGAQKVGQYEDAPHTGAVSARMLKAAGASFAIIGHSERRAEGETDEKISAKIQRASEADLGIVLCVGEHTRDASGAHFEFLSAQLRTALASFPKMDAAKLVVAYEPVWAIGKSAADAMKPADVRETAIFIRKILADMLGRDAARKVAVLYGGSVEPGNAGALIEQGDISGFLVGHASAELASFLEILKACKK